MKVLQYQPLLPVIALILALSTSAGFGQQPAIEDADLYYTGLKTIKKICYTYQLTMDGYQQQLSDILQVDFNHTGNITDSTKLDSTGNLQGHVFYLYNPGGYLIEKKRFNSDNELTAIQYFHYDSTWTCVEKTWQDTVSKILKTITYKYSTTGLFKQIITSTDSIYEKINFHYDDNDRLVEKRWYDRNNNLRRKAEFTDTGKHSGILLYKPDGSLHWEYIYTLPTKTGQREIHITNDQVNEIRSEFIHDSQAQTTEFFQYDESGQLVYKIIYKYNPSGNFEDIEEYNIFEKLISKIEYEYDSQERLLSIKYLDMDYSTGDLAEIPRQVEFYEYEDY